jgi:hypothetical protein
VRFALQRFRPAIYVNTHYGGGPYLQSSGTNTTLSNWIKTRITEISGEMGFSFPWSYRSSGVGSGLAIGDGNSFGANSWLWEIASHLGPYGTGGGYGTGGSTYMHTAQTLEDIENWYFPRSIPVLRAMCESCEVQAPPTTQYELTIELTGGKGWTVPNYGVYEYDAGSVVTVTAYSNPGYYFSYWSVDGDNYGSENPLQLTMDSDHTLRAMYTPESTNPSAQVIISSTGTIQSNP